jgi:hypothetical protein
MYTRSNPALFASQCPRASDQIAFQPTITGVRDRFFWARLVVEQRATRRCDQDTAKTESSLLTVPLPANHANLIPELKSWKRSCPMTPVGLVFPGRVPPILRLIWSWTQMPFSVLL